MMRKIVLAAMVLLLLGAAGATSRGGDHEEDEIPFAEAELFFELNDTDGDLGIHSSIDGEPWTSLKIEDASGRTVLNIRSRGRLGLQGLTQLFFESAEPPFDELDPADFFARFPEGEYEIEGQMLEDGELESVAELSHVMAAPPANVTLNGLPAAEDCDADPLPLVSAPVVIRWDPVTTSHPEIGKAGPVEIDGYQFFVEADLGGIAVDLPPTVTEFEIPAAVLALVEESEIKFEIIARTDSGNNTAVESCFEVE